MDDSFGSSGFSSAFSSNLFGGSVKGQDGTIHRTNIISFHSPPPHVKGFKRKWTAVRRADDKKDASPLLLGLRHSSSSSDNSKMSTATVCTMSSAKETDEETSMDLGLNFHLHLTSDSSPSPKRPAIAFADAPDKEPVCDLQLSLSTGPSQSVITSVFPASDKHPSMLEESVNVGSVPFDDGWASVCWNSEGSSRPDSNPSQANETQLLSANATSTKEPVTCSSGLTQQRITASTKTCQFRGCGKGARGASGLCIAHGGGRRCQREGCQKGAEGRTVYCKAHGGGRRCQFLGCMKSAEGRTDYCIAHGGGRRCCHDGCTRAARGKSGLCIKHGGGKRCQRENCTKSAEGYSGLCISHGGGRRCQYPACSKGAQGSTMFCKAHGGGKRCTASGCNKGAEGSTLFCKGHGGGKRCAFQGGGACPKSVHGGTQFCVAHGGGKRCSAPECTKSARGRTDFCVRHGGGKRCRVEGCAKSAQGRTDFCKAHGGGKRCSWGQPGSGIGPGGPPCDRFARGKTGLCAAHCALLQDHRIHGGGALGASPQRRQEDAPPTTPSISDPGLLATGEGRVHGGSLMAMLADGSSLSSPPVGFGGAEEDRPAERVAECLLPRRWM